MITIEEVQSIKSQLETDGITPASGETLRAVCDLAISQHGEIERLRDIAGNRGDIIFMMEKEIAKAKREREEAYEKAAQEVESLEVDNPHGLMDEEAHNGTLLQAAYVIRALKSGEPK